MSAAPSAMRVPMGRLAQRRERLLVEAERLFLHKGYAGASVNEIVRRAGGSLATLYSEFGSKEALFAEIMRRRARAVFECDAELCAQTKSPRVALVALATRLLERRLSEDSLAIYRIAVNEAPRFPELRATILDDSYPSFIRSVAEALVRIRVVSKREAEPAAEELVSLVHGQLLFRAACGGSGSISAKQRTQHVARAVDAFLRLYPTSLSAA